MTPLLGSSQRRPFGVNQDFGAAPVGPASLDQENALIGLIAPADPEYDAARAVFNAAIDRRPGRIAQCVSPNDVAQAVNRGNPVRLIISSTGLREPREL
jgi:hypothetical protein